MCRKSAERTSSTHPSSKQRSAPRRPVWCSKVVFNGPTRRKNGTRLVHVCFLFVWLVEWPVSCRYWPCTIVRVFFRRPFTRKGHIFCLWGSLWRLFGYAQCVDTRRDNDGGWRNCPSCRTFGWRNWQDRRHQISFHGVFQKEPASVAVESWT